MSTSETNGQKLIDVIAALESIELVAWRLKQWEEAVKNNNIKNLNALNERSSKQAGALHAASIRD